MWLELDTTLCDAHGRCVLVAPELFDLGDDDAIAIVRDSHPDEELRTKAQAAVAICPSAAISLTDTLVS